MTSAASVVHYLYFSTYVDLSSLVMSPTFSKNTSYSLRNPFLHEW